MKKAVIYARFDGDESKAFSSIESQIKECSDYACANGIEVVKTFIDVPPEKGQKDKRPSYQEMLRDSFHKKWDIVLVTTYDRLPRRITRWAGLRQRKTVIAVNHSLTAEEQQEAWRRIDELYFTTKNRR